MEIERTYQYACCAAVLAEDHEVPGCEAIFDQALSNALLAIVARRWPGEEQEPKGRMRSAMQLLAVIDEKADVQSDGTRFIRWTDDADSECIPVDTGTLRDGVTKTQARRHGRGKGTLEQRHVDALLALDQHPPLGRIPEVVSDGQGIKAEVQDLYERDRAAKYLNFIGDEEARVRAERAPELVEWYHPKHNPDREGCDLEDCAVCGYESLKLDYSSEFADTGSGACLVCSYTRSPDTAYYLTMNAEIKRAIENDD